MNPLEMMMQMVMGGEQQAPQPTPGMPRDFLEGKRLRPGRVTGMPEQPDPMMGQGMVPVPQQMGPEPQMMGPQPEGAGIDPEMIRLMMMGGAG